MTYIQHQRKPRLVTVFLADSLITVCSNFPAFIFVMQIIRRKLRADSVIRRLFCIKRTDKGDIAVIICVILRSRYNRIIMRKVAAERQIKNMPWIFSTKLRIECIVKKKDIIAVIL